MPLDPILAPFVEQIKGDLPNVPIEVERAESLAASEAQLGVAIEPAPDGIEGGRLWLPGPAGAPRVLVKT